MRRNGLAGLGMSLALAMALAACATGGASPTAAPTPDPTATPAAAPLGMFTGHDKCRDAPEDVPDKVIVTCDRVATDPRLSGRLLGENHGLAELPDLYTSWAKFTLTNDGGTWTCDEIMMGSMEGRVGFKDQVCVGEGAYKGLTAYLLTLSNNATADFGIFGWIEETP